MNILLDTHSLLWFLLDDPRLSETARERIIAEDHSIFISPVNLWEIAIKISLGKYSLPEPFETFWNRQLVINDIEVLPISVSHTSQVVNLPFHHRDPFDRLIIAQALVEKMPVVSRDAVFDLYGVERIW